MSITAALVRMASGPPLHDRKILLAETGLSPLCDQTDGHGLRIYRQPLRVPRSCGVMGRLRKGDPRLEGTKIARELLDDPDTADLRGGVLHIVGSQGRLFISLPIVPVPTGATVLH